MKIRKEGNKTIINLTDDERFNKFLENQVRRAKRDKWVMRVLVCIYLAIIALLLSLRLLKLT